MTFNPALHGLRGIAAMMVLLFHWKGSFPILSLNLKAVPFLGTEWDLFFFINFGWTGVHWFFVLSGFLLAAKLGERALSRGEVMDFWQRRVVRIYPAVWLQLSLLLTFSYAVGLLVELDWHKIAGNYLLWSHPLPGGVSFYNGVYWTLPLELSFYLLLPFLVMLQLKIGFWKLLLLCTAITLLWRFGIIWLREYTDHFPRLTLTRTVLPGMLTVFMAGYALTRFPQNLSHRSRYAILASALLAYIAWHHWLIGYHQSHSSTDPWILTWELALAVLIALIIGPLLRPLKGFHWLGSRPLVWLGDISYGIYLWHFPVLRMLPRLWPNDWHTPGNTLLALAICLAITLPLAALSHYGVEKPLMNWIARRQKRRQPANAPSPSPVRAR